MLSSYNFGFWDEWLNPQKVTFDGDKKLIIINYGFVDIDVKIDIYSNWKEWVKIRDNLKFQTAIRSVGGDPINEEQGRYLGSTFFLTNGWKMRTWEADHKLSVVGNLYADQSNIYGTNLFVPTQDPHNIEIILTVSNITEVTKPTVIVSGIEIPTAQEISTAVWNTPVIGNSTTGTFGEFISKRLLSVGKFLGLK